MVNCGEATENVGQMMKSIHEMFEKRITQLGHIGGYYEK